MSTLYESFYTMFSGLYNDVAAAPQPNGMQKPVDQPNKGAPPPGIQGAPTPQANHAANGSYMAANGATYPNPNQPQQVQPPVATPQAMRQNGVPQGSPQGGPQGAGRAQSPQPTIRNRDISLDANKGNTQSPMPNRNQGGYSQDPMQTPERRKGYEDGGGGVSSTAQPGSGPSTYVADKEDLLDQHVAYYLRHHPDVHRRHHLVRKRPGVYELNGREVLVEWQYATEPGGQGHLVVLDGPLRQPFSDYMECNEYNAEYDTQSIGSRSALHQIPKDKRMSFGDQHKVYTRLEAMKVAKEQALVRETHADYLKDGRSAPNDLMDKYKKTISQKLGPYRRSAPQPESPPQATPPPAASSTQPATNGAPKQSPQPTPAVQNHKPPTGSPSPQAPAYGMQPPGYQPPGYPGTPSYTPPPGTTTAMPPYTGAPIPGMVRPQGLFQQNMGGVQPSSYRPPVAGTAQAYPMRWG